MTEAVTEVDFCFATRAARFTLPPRFDQAMEQGMMAERKTQTERRAVRETTVGLSQTLMLTDRSAMDHILETIRNIHAHSAELAKKA